MLMTPPQLQALCVASPGTPSIVGIHAVPLGVPFLRDVLILAFNNNERVIKQDI